MSDSKNMQEIQEDNKENEENLQQSPFLLKKLKLV